MKKSKMSKMVLFIAVIAIICCVAGVSRATGNVDALIENIVELPDTNTASNNNNVVNNATTTIGGGNNTTNITNITQTNTTNSALPKTGVNDTIMWVLIGVSAVAALYTYKKVRDYNV